ncbi:MAG: Crp/Fnr family transcriptional regulator [Terriglobales bacterium]|jgi:CRP/FNR family transcriptional regulator
MRSRYILPAEYQASHQRPDDFFCTLSPESRQAFSRITISTVFPEGAVIFIEEEAPLGVFRLREGQAKLSTNARDGRTFALRIAKAGELLGLDAVVAGKPYSLTAETMQRCQLDFVGRSDFLRFLKEHSDACLHAAEVISRECHDAYTVVRSFCFPHSATVRIAKLLLAAAKERSATNGVLRARLALTHEEIAQLVGTTRETITRTLSELRKKEIVEQQGASWIIRDKPALERLGAA